MGTQTLDNNTLAVVYYLISQLSGALGKTHLQKLLFLSDLISMRRLKKQITVFEYKQYKHGPFATAVNDYTKELESKDLIEAKELPFVSDPDKKYIKFYAKKALPIKDSLIKKMGPDTMVVLDEVIGSYGNMSLQSLLDIVYDIQIVRDSKMDQSLPLDIAEDIKEEPDQENDLFEL